MGMTLVFQNRLNQGQSIDYVVDGVQQATIVGALGRVTLSADSVTQGTRDAITAKRLKLLSPTLSDLVVFSSDVPGQSYVPVEQTAAVVAPGFSSAPLQVLEDRLTAVENTLVDWAT